MKKGCLLFKRSTVNSFLKFKTFKIRSKEIYRKKAAQCLQEGRRNEARECFQRCIECTPKMALDVIKVKNLYKSRFD